MVVLSADRAGRSALAAIVLVMCLGRPAAAQQPEPPTPAVPQLDVIDIVRAVRNKPPAPPEDPNHPQRMFVIAPVFGSKPNTGPFIGAAGNVAFHRGDPETTQISTSVFSLTFSAKAQTLANVRFNLYTSENRWVVVGDNRFQWTSGNTFDLGTSSSNDSAVLAKYNFFRVHDTVYRHLVSNVFVGGGLLFNTHTNIHPGENEEAAWEDSPHVVYSQVHGLPVDSATSAGLSVAARIDTRDSTINPRRGHLLDGSYRVLFQDLFGGDSGWQEADFEARIYRDMTKNGRHILGAWVLGNFITSGVAPYFDLPATAMDMYGRSGRAYQEGRFRGEHAMYAEVEYRGTLTANGLVGMVAFVNGTTVSSQDANEALFHSIAPGAGLGVRLLLNKHSKTNVCFDVGWGRDNSHGVYVAIQEVF